MSVLAPGMRFASVRALATVTAGMALGQLSLVPWWLPVLIVVPGILFVRISRGFSIYLILAGAAFLLSRSAQPAPVDAKIYQVQQFRGLVVQEPTNRQTFTIQLAPPLAGKVFVGLKDSSACLHYGDVVQVKSRIKRFDFPRNPGIPDRNQQLLRQGYAGNTTVNSDQIRIISRNAGNPVLTRIVMPVRRYLFRTWEHYLTEKEAGLLFGVLLSEKGLLKPELESSLTSTGLWHIMAVSGLHMGIVVMVIYLLVSVLHIRSWTRFVILTLATLTYALLAGWNPAAIRAGIMAWAYFLGLALQRRTTPLNTVSVAGIALLLFSPNSLSSIGMQLSFCATMAIILILPKLEKWLSWLRGYRIIYNYLALPTTVSIAATFGIAPLTAHYFYQFQPLSFIAAVLVLPLISLIIPLGLLVPVINLFAPAAAGIAANSLSVLLNIAHWLITKLSGLIGSFMVNTGSLSWLTIFYCYALVLLLLNWHRKWAKTAFLIGLVPGLIIAQMKKALERPMTRFTFLDPGKGDAILLEDTLGRKLLIDAGIGKPEVLNEFLLSRRIQYLDAVIITHPDLDHYGGLLNLNPDIRIRRLFVSTLSGDSIYNQLLAHLKSTGTTIYTVSAGARLTGFGLEIDFKSPDQLTQSLYNRHLIPTNPISIVNLVQYDTFAFLFTGDCESWPVLTRIARVRKIHFLKAPHHGSKKGNPPELYDTLRPDYVIVMGRYPTPAGLEKLLPERNIVYLNTRKQGGLVLKFVKGKPVFCPN